MKIKAYSSSVESVAIGKELICEAQIQDTKKPAPVASAGFFSE